MGLREPLKNSGSHIDASHSRQPLVKGERLVRYEVNAVMTLKHCNRLVLRWSGLQSCFPGAAQCFVHKPLDSSCSKLGNESVRQAQHRTADNTWQRDGQMLSKETRERKEHASSSYIQTCTDAQIVTPKGVLLPASCHASATREGP